MSHYLVDRIESSPRIEVMTETEITAVHGTATVESATLRDNRDGSSQDVGLHGGLRDDRRGPVHGGGRRSARHGRRRLPALRLERADCPGHLCWPLNDREPHLLETIRPGVFAAGDVRAGASKRVAGAVGDGALVVRFAYDVLAG
jgi:thioredoxin reductase (NADPH)